MGLNKQKILKISITYSSKQNILEYINKGLKNASNGAIVGTQNGQKPLLIFTPNPEQLVYAVDHPGFAKILNQADITPPDGIGLVWASRFLTGIAGENHIKLRVAGVELMADLVQIASKRSITVALIGGRNGLAVKAFECLQAKYSGLTGWAEELPEMNIDGDFLSLTNGENFDTLVQKIADKITTRKTKIVFIGLGAPKQEYLIAALRNVLPAKQLVLMAVGGSFDIIAGKIKRAPERWQKSGFEWLWRLFHEPWRIGRQLALIKFIYYIILQKIGLFRD